MLKILTDWTGEKSIKERFPLKEKYVNTFCDGTFTLEKQIEKLRERAQKSEKELASMATLSQEMQSAIVEKKLVPTMRTFYNRTAFQLPGDARVRISLDTELTMVREDNYDGVMRAGTNWRRMDIGTDWPFTQLEESDVCRFPYAVLEVKLQTNVGAEPPAWVTDLINSHLVEEVPKFSKFIHGCATLLENRVTLLPFWLPQMAKDIRKPAPERYHLSHDHAQSQDLMIEETRVRKGKGKARASGSSSAAPSFMDDVPPTPRNGSGSRAPNGVDHHVVHLGDVDDASEEFDAAEESSALLGGDDGGPQPTGKKPKGILGQIQGLVNKLHVRDAREQRQRRQQRGGGAYGGTSVAGSAEGDARSAVTGLHGADINSRIPAEMHGKRIIIPVRVEPKVFFANERTFLAWMHFSSVIAGLALGLLNFGDKVGQIAGIVFTLNAMLIMAYGLYLFQWRAEKIRNRETGPYDDRGGPTFVVLTLFAAMVINFYLKLSTI
ncbi:VTC domain-containing protein [Blastocladiella britannica]|nr:VTC domain-containing protein [Blastocladiella britannica]